MGIFGSIVSKIFPHGSKSMGGPSTEAQSTASATAPTGDGATAPAPGPAMAEVDVEAVLEDLASKASERLNWRSSIVDLMKLLGLDSSLSARKELARELHYSGDTEDSAAMNVWLHSHVMRKLAENGGKVPDSLIG